MPTIVVGAGGMLGRDVVAVLDGDVVALTRAELDVTDADAVRRAISGADTVVNCAAFTDVDGAESADGEAMRVNREGARNVAEHAGRVLYVSTDYVFDGSKPEPYVESDATGPLQAYGRSKLAGEHATAEANHDHLIVRTSWLFGAGGRNFVDTMLTLGPDVRVVADQIGAPTFTGHLAHGIRELLESDARGIRHVAAGGSCSWYELARETFALSGLDVRVEPCTTADFPRPAPRPANSVLRSERGGPVLPPWQDGLVAYLEVRA